MKKSFKFKLLLGVLLFLAVALTVVDELVRYGIMSTYTRSIIWIVVSTPLWLPIAFFMGTELIKDMRERSFIFFVLTLPLVALYQVFIVMIVVVYRVFYRDSGNKGQNPDHK